MTRKATGNEKKSIHPCNLQFNPTISKCCHPSYKAIIFNNLLTLECKNEFKAISSFHFGKKGKTLWQNKMVAERSLYFIHPESRYCKLTALLLINCFFNLMVPFYGWGSTISRLQNQYKEVVYFLRLIFPTKCCRLNVLPNKYSRLNVICVCVCVCVCVICH